MDERLRSLYPAEPALEFSSPFTLLVAAILAAQCTDERVNRVTKTLFSRFPCPQAFADAPLEEIEAAVHSTGFYRQKARTLKACSRALVDRFDSDVPPSLDALVSLPGVGRKTAILVLGNSMGVPGVFVDTHVGRLARRLGLTSALDPDRVEADLTPLLPPERRTPFSNLLTHLGRSVCVSRSPRCGACPVADLCPKIGVDWPPPHSRRRKSGDAT